MRDRVRDHPAQGAPSTCSWRRRRPPEPGRPDRGHRQARPPRRIRSSGTRARGSRDRWLGRLTRCRTRDRHSLRRALLEPVHGLADLLAAGIAPIASATTPLDVGPPLSDRRQPRADPRGLADARRLGAGHRAGPHRPDGRGQHVPRADAHREDGHDPRPHLERPGHPRHRRRMVRDGARGLRPPVRRRLPERLRWLGEALRSCAACSTASARPRPGRATRRRRSATTRRRSRSACRSSSAAAASRSRSSSWPGTAMRTTSAAGSRTCSARRRSSLQHCETVGRDPAEIERTTGIGHGRSSATRARRPQRVQRGDVRAQRPGRPVERPAGRHARGRRRAARAATSRSATATSSRASRHPTTRSR